MAIITCYDCNRAIGPREEYTRQDKTGFAFCIKCSDRHVDVTMNEEEAGNYVTLEECKASGEHNKSVDADGYCNGCGEQEA